MDRRELLDTRDKMKRLIAHPLLPPEIKAKAKEAVDHADVVLGLQDAQKRALLKGLPIPIPQSGARPLPQAAPSSQPDLIPPSMRGQSS